ncbi:hypothetical protein PCANB_000947 [Pneumocystis canis]|nr:hypothetical protein PCANB_000947 [Pneumocystis canis]
MKVEQQRTKEGRGITAKRSFWLKSNPCGINLIIFGFYGFVFCKECMDVILIMQSNDIQKVFPLKNVNLFPRFEKNMKKSTNSYSSFDLVFALPQYYQKNEYLGSMKKYVKLTMKPNLDILNEKSFLQVHNEHNEIIYSKKINRDDYKIYSGETFITYTDNDIGKLQEKWYKTGWSRISLLQDGNFPVFEGFFTLFDDIYTVRTLENYMLLKESHEPDIFGYGKNMLIWQDSDQPIQRLRRRDMHNNYMFSDFNDDYILTSLNSSEFIFDSKKNKKPDSGKFKLSPSRYQLSTTIGDISGCPKYKKVAFMGAALDCNYISVFPSINHAVAHILSLYNKVSVIYEKSFNISLGLLNITIMNSSCPIQENPNVRWNTDCSSYNITERLRFFSTWRSRINDDIALWSLFTTCRSFSEVGVAWYGVLCQDVIPKKHSIDAISGTNVIASPKRNEDVVLAHEIGHGFGASHDCTAETCQNDAISCCPLSSISCNTDERYIMSPRSSLFSRAFSPCTVGQICSNIGKKLINSKCLISNKNITLISQKKCGNGIVEDGEDCDCGGEEGCRGNSCCNPKTCKFTHGSVCDDSNEACCKNCKFAPKNTVCRSSRDECDIVEVCSGNSSECPSDQFKKDGAPCSNGLKCASDGTPCGFYGYCYKGNCIEASLGNQLKTLLTGFKKWIFIIIFVLGLFLVLIINYIFNNLRSYKKQEKHNFDENYHPIVHIPVYTDYPYYYHQNIPPNYMSQAYFDPSRNYSDFDQRNIYYKMNPSLETYYNREYRYK